jgi:hypothetical protein
MNDIDVLLKKYDRAQTKLLRSDLDAHDKNRVQKKTQIYVNVSSLNSFVFARFSVSARFIRVDSSFIIITRTLRISTKRRFKILIVSKTDEFSRDARDVMNDDDDEEFDVNVDDRSNCIQCCRISMNCRRVASIVCDRCFKQKIACISIRFEFVCFMISYLIFADLDSLSYRRLSIVERSCRFSRRRDINEDIHEKANDFTVLFDCLRS